MRLDATVKRELDAPRGGRCRASTACPASRSVRRRSWSCLHHTSPSGVSATLVKMVSLFTAAMQLALVSSEVRGRRRMRRFRVDRVERPSACGLIQAMSSPMVVTFQPFSASGGISMARLVLPQALGMPPRW